jgi:hypothetical protein
MTTTDHDRQHPEAGQEWSWGPLFCRVMTVTPKYAHLMVHDGHGSWIKAQPLPLAPNFNLFWEDDHDSDRPA